MILTYKELADLLLRAADKLQDYCTEANGDLNDSLAMDIYAALKWKETPNEPGN